MTRPGYGFPQLSVVLVADWESGISIYRAINSKRRRLTSLKTWLDLPTHRRRKHRTVFVSLSKYSATTSGSSDQGSAAGDYPDWVHDTFEGR
jgi:hypothetical protein